MPVSEKALEDRVEQLAAACREVLSRSSTLPIQAAFLYGSALGTGFRADSDVDIAVLDDADEPLSWEDQARLMDALERATGHGLDLRMLRESSLSHQSHVLEQGLLLWSREPLRVPERYARKVRAAVRQEHERVERDWSSLLLKLAGSAAPRR